MMFGRHLILPVDVRLGVVQEKPNSGLGGWVQEIHHQKLKYAYNLAHRKMTTIAEQTKHNHDQELFLTVYRRSST